MTKISISYRRKDSDAITGRIFDRLVAHYGADAVFRDIDNIPPGYDFRKYISSALESTDILLAIVGPQWTGKTEGRTRINEATDLVRIEIEAALRPRTFRSFRCWSATPPCPTRASSRIRCKTSPFETPSRSMRWKISTIT